MMGRRTVWIPDELEATVLEQLAEVNWSAALQAGVRALLECGHDELRCTGCGEVHQVDALTGPPLRELYRSAMFELGLNVDRPGYVGAAAIVRRVAIAHGVNTEGVPLPRGTAAVYEHRREEAFAAAEAERATATLEAARQINAAAKAPAATPLPLEADSRRRHPTARPVPANHPGPRPAPAQEQTA